MPLNKETKLNQTNILFCGPHTSSVIVDMPESNFITHTYLYVFNDLLSRMSRVFANGQGDRGSIQSRVIPKT